MKMSWKSYQNGVRCESRGVFFLYISKSRDGSLTSESWLVVIEYVPSGPNWPAERNQKGIAFGFYLTKLSTKEVRVIDGWAQGFLLMMDWLRFFFLRLTFDTRDISVRLFVPYDQFFSYIYTFFLLKNKIKNQTWNIINTQCHIHI